MRPAADGGRSALLTIGEVLGELAPQFPDVSHSKIRFLEERGLVTPQRTASGYRKYSPADVDRLQFVLALQRDRYLPLKVIGEYLAALDRGAEPPPLPQGPVRPPPRLDTAGTGAVASGERGPSPEGSAGTGAAARVGRVAREDLEAAAGGDTALVDSLIDHGLLVRDAAGGGPADAADVVRAARELAGYGIQPRHLRPLRSATEREAALLEQVTSPLRRQHRPGSAERAQEVEGEVLGLLLRLHSSLLRTVLEGHGD